MAVYSGVRLFVCDNCDRQETVKDESIEKPPGWSELRTTDVLHFDGYGCLSEWVNSR